MTSIQFDPQDLKPLVEQVVREVFALSQSNGQQNGHAPGPILWSWADIAETTRISEKSLRRRERDGSFGPSRVESGSAVRFYRAEVESWIPNLRLTFETKLPEADGQGRPYPKLNARPVPCF